jgi:hypothetical protein
MEIKNPRDDIELQRQSKARRKRERYRERLSQRVREREIGIQRDRVGQTDLVSTRVT